MPELLLELFSEEIPARMQARAEADLLKALGGALNAAGLSYDTGFAVSGPRRLTAVLQGLSARSDDVREERKGPKVGAPEKAVEGFLRGAGLSSVDEAEVREDPKKGAFYVAVIETPGRPAADIIAEAVPEIIRGFHWPKSMRWGEGELRWVRPLHRISCVLDGAVVPFDVGGIASGNETEGHRVHGRGPFTVTGWEDYRAQLEGAGHVILSRDDRKARILKAARAACRRRKLALVEDEGLLEEVAGLAEWPQVVLGDMDPAYLSLPPEVIRLSMRTHQKYFAVRDPKTGALAPHFVVVANLKAKDGGKQIAAGNARVLAARLDDARFFWENDLATPLEAMAARLGSIAFKEELGSLGDKVERVTALARELAPLVGADAALAERAAQLCKADLVSQMVYEFPELQGVMGRYYALEAGEPADIADAIADHYRPQGPSDAVPAAPVSIAVALADKIDTLTGFWAIGEKPTGSKDPFALRRAALGVVRINLFSGREFGLRPILSLAFSRIIGTAGRMSFSRFEYVYNRFVRDQDFNGNYPDDQWMSGNHDAQDTIDDLLAFIADRLKVHLKDHGIRHDLIDAVFALGEDDMVLISKRAEALQSFLCTYDGSALLAGYKRAANILKAELKKDRAEAYDGAVDESLIEAEAERDLHAAIETARAAADAALAQEDFQGAMAALAPLRAPVDRFFDEVTVNDERGEIRRNRLLILSAIRDALHRVADFSKIEG